MEALFKRGKGQEPHNDPTVRKHIKIVRALVRSGYPMYTLNFYKQLPINLLLQKEWNVPVEVICKVLKAHIDSGFDVL